MMLEPFKTESRAFYRFGDLLMLEKIPEEHWIGFIQTSFKNTGEKINKDLVNLMIRSINNHPDYLQQLCHNAWNATEKQVTEESIKIAMDLVVRSNALHYQDISESLSNTQLKLFFAILNGETKLTATQTMQKY